VARYVGGDGELVDRARLSGRHADVPPLSELDELMGRSWNDPEGYLDARDASLLAVEQIARRLGPSRLGPALKSLAGNGSAAGLEKMAGMSLGQLDAAWRASLPGARAD
jgi:hypothetical protein